MLPPIFKQGSGPSLADSDAVKRRGSASESTGTGSMRSDRGDSESDFFDPVRGTLIERVGRLERENSQFRDEILHLRHLLSNNNLHSDDQKLSLHQVSEEVHQLLSSFNSKMQADKLLNQRDQQKMALLFAEVTRLGHSVELLEHNIKIASEEVKRKIEQHESQLLVIPSTIQQRLSPNKGALDQHHLHRQNEDLQLSIAWMKQALGQLRTEIDSDRNDQWKADSERSQCISDLRAAIARAENSVDTRITMHLERIRSQLAADRIEVNRSLEDNRTVFSRIASQMMETTRVNEHLLSLERWIHGEHSKIKRIIQAGQEETDKRLDMLVNEINMGLRMWNGLFVQQEDAWRLQFHGLHEATVEVSGHVQRKLAALEEVVSMEVKARQTQDDMLRQRIDFAVNWVSKAIEEVKSEAAAITINQRGHTGGLSVSTCLIERLEVLERSQSQVGMRLEEHKKTTAEAIRVLKQRGVAEGNTSQNGHGSDLTQAPSESELQSRLFEQVRMTMNNHLLELSTSLMEELSCRNNDLLSKIETIASDQGDAIARLQQWTVTHAHECRQCYEYFQWTLDQTQAEAIVRQTLEEIVLLVTTDELR